MLPRRAMLLRPGLAGSLLTGAAAGHGSEAIAGVPSGTGGPPGTGEAPPARPIAGCPGGLELSEENPVGLSGGTAMEFTDDLDLTIGYYDIANESLLDLVPEADPEETAGQANPRPGEHPLGLQRPRLVVR